jgi:hypothetical protein
MLERKKKEEGNEKGKICFALRPHTQKHIRGKDQDEDFLLIGSREPCAVIAGPLIRGGWSQYTCTDCMSELDVS